MTIQQKTTIYFYSRKMALQKPTTISAKPTTIFAKPMIMIALPYARVYKFIMYARERKTNMPRHLKRI